MSSRTVTGIESKVSLHLLDPSQGRLIQAWHFSDQDAIMIGRSAENDISLADEQVSRIHSKIVWQDGVWHIISLGRNGTLINDRLIAEQELTDQTIFKLGPSGPLLRFCLDKQEKEAPLHNETVSSFDPAVIAMLLVDEQRKEEEVAEIAESELFQSLVDQSHIMKARRRQSEK